MGAPPDAVTAADAGDSDTTFATGMLAGLGLRELRSESSACPVKPKVTADRHGADRRHGAGAADMLNGQLGDIDKLIMLSKLQAQQGHLPVLLECLALLPVRRLPDHCPAHSPLSPPAPMFALAAAQPQWDQPLWRRLPARPSPAVASSRCFSNK